jgi:hypothetical protein
MNEEFPPAGAEQGINDQHPERAVVHVTGDERADGAVAALSRLASLPVEEHVAVLEEVHGRLRDILGELDEPGDNGERR